MSSWGFDNISLLFSGTKLHRQFLLQINNMILLRFRTKIRKKLFLKSRNKLKEQKTNRKRRSQLSASAQAPAASTRRYLPLRVSFPTRGLRGNFNASRGVCTAALRLTPSLRARTGRT